jgi:uncharacterized protein (TIGR04255 family)
MVKEEPVNSMLMQLGPGGAATTSPIHHEGTSFQNVRGDQTIIGLNITKQSIRFETGIYTRWAAFFDQLSSILYSILPILSQSTTMQSVGLEYIDFFYAILEGPEDVGLILDNQSGLIAKRAFRKRDPFHTHSGWFTAETANSRNLINVDLTVADAKGPAGVRRTISVRTFEAEHVSSIHGPRAVELMALAPVMQAMDRLHHSLKTHLDSVLTRDAKAMISLGSA